MAKSKAKKSDGDSDATTAVLDAPVGTLDRDVKDVDPGKGKGEVGPLILPGYWVILADHEDVPERHVGNRAQIIESPWAAAPIGVPDQPIAGYTYDEDKLYLVKTRDEANALLELPEEAFSRVAETNVALGR